MILLLAATCYGQGFYNSRATSYSSPDGAGTARMWCSRFPFSTLLYDILSAWAFGTVFDIVNPPMGSLRARVHYANQDQAKTSQLTFAIPRDWKVGVEYDTASQHN
ncbi:unnamed protein product [Fraxinus pennsylvanica]|uniref:Uncharacterized protein n=1 Tax=Fraxinus pennsylvanica TaxID=56036 RepID=A0AAD2DPQ6_9LAMI|nr:unnamed protein product [Fraxinus pennsylvanica]